MWQIHFLARSTCLAPNFVFILLSNLQAKIFLVNSCNFLTSKPPLLAMNNEDAQWALLIKPFLVKCRFRQFGYLQPSIRTLEHLLCDVFQWVISTAKHHRKHTSTAETGQQTDTDMNLEKQWNRGYRIDIIVPDSEVQSDLLLQVTASLVRLSAVLRFLYLLEPK